MSYSCLPVESIHLSYTQGVGAPKQMLAHVALQLPNAELQAKMAGGAAAAATVPKVSPAAE